jgi:hypothetical protein
MPVAASLKLGKAYLKLSSPSVRFGTVPCLVGRDFSYFARVLLTSLLCVCRDWTGNPVILVPWKAYRGESLDFLRSWTRTRKRRYGNLDFRDEPKRPSRQGKRVPVSTPPQHAATPPPYSLLQRALTSAGVACRCSSTSRTHSISLEPSPASLLAVTRFSKLPFVQRTFIRLMPDQGAVRGLLARYF